MRNYTLDAHRKAVARLNALKDRERNPAEKIATALSQTATIRTYRSICWTVHFGRWAGDGRVNADHLVRDGETRTLCGKDVARHLADAQAPGCGHNSFSNVLPDHVVRRIDADGHDESRDYCKACAKIAKRELA